MRGVARDALPPGVRQRLRRQPPEARPIPSAPSDTSISRCASGSGPSTTSVATAARRVALAAAPAGPARDDHSHGGTRATRRPLWRRPSPSLRRPRPRRVPRLLAGRDQSDPCGRRRFCEVRSPATRRGGRRAAREAGVPQHLERRVDPALCLELIRESDVRLPFVNYETLFRDGTGPGVAPLFRQFYSRERRYSQPASSAASSRRGATTQNEKAAQVVRGSERLNDPRVFDQPTATSAARPVGGGSPAHGEGRRSPTPSNDAADQQPQQREQVPDNEIHKRPEQMQPPSITARAPNLARARQLQGAATSLRTLRVVGAGADSRTCGMRRSSAGGWLSLERHNRRRAEEAYLHSRRGKARPLRGHGEVAGGDELAAGRGSDPVHLRDHGLRNVVDRLHQHRADVESRS